MSFCTKGRTQYQLKEREVIIPGTECGTAETYALEAVSVQSTATIEHRYEGQVPIWKFFLQELAGCCGILVSYHTGIAPTYQGKKLGQKLQILKEFLARKLGYSVLLCTCVSKMEEECHILEKTGWTKIDQFVNQRTSNLVYVWTKHLYKDPEPPSAHSA